MFLLRYSTFARHILRRRGNNGIVASLDEDIVERPDVHLRPAIVIGLNDAYGLAATSSERQDEANMFREGVDAHCRGQKRCWKEKKKGKK